MLDKTTDVYSIRLYNTAVYSENPFTFGISRSTTPSPTANRELAALLADLRNGQDVLLVAPRRYGKSSLALRAVQAATREDIRVASCHLMRTPTKERFAGALAKTIHDDLASPVDQARDRAAGLFRGLRIRPTIELDPDDGGTSASRFARAGPARTSTTRSSISSSCPAASRPSGSGASRSCSTSSRRSWTSIRSCRT